MEPISEKVYLRLLAISEDAPVSDQQRIRLALQELGYEVAYIESTKKLFGPNVAMGNIGSCLQIFGEYG